MHKQFNITTHAIEQFIRRWEPEKDAQQAEEELSALLATSRSVGKTREGSTIMVSGHRPEIRMVVKEHDVCVTVLPPGTWADAIAGYDDNLLQLQAEYQEHVKQAIERNRGELEHQLATLQQELENNQNQLAQINEQRAKLGALKQETVNNIQGLKSDISKLQKMLNIAQPEEELP